MDNTGTRRHTAERRLSWICRYNSVRTIDKNIIDKILTSTAIVYETMYSFIKYSYTFCYEKCKTTQKYLVFQLYTIYNIFTFTKVYLIPEK